MKKNIIRKVYFVIICLFFYSANGDEFTMWDEMYGDLSQESIEKLKALPTNYSFDISILNQQCEFLVNDFPLENTANDVMFEEGGIPKTFGWSMGHSIGRIMQNGENTITLRALGDHKNIHAKPGEQYCKVTIYAEKTGVIQQEVSNIVISYDDEKQTLVTTQSTIYEGRDVIERDITAEVVDSVVYEDGKDIVFSRKLIGNNLPEFRWTKATPYTDTPEQRAKLVKAYQQLETLLRNKDLDALRQLFLPAFEEKAHLDGGFSANAIFDSLGLDYDFKEKGFHVRPIHYDDYVPVLYNQGRQVRLYHKDYLYYLPYKKGSAYKMPLKMYFFNDDSEFSTLNPVFSLVDGEFVITF